MIKIVCLRIALLAPMVMWFGCTSAPPPRNAVSPVSHAPNIAGVRVAAWFGYRQGRTFADLAPAADLLDSVSVCGQMPTAEFLAECRARGIKTYRMVIGGAEHYDTPERSDATIAQYLEWCRDPGFDGIDLDYESLTPDGAAAYGRFIRALAAQLHRAGKKLTICVFNPGTGRPGLYAYYDLDALAEACDYVKVMCYDLHMAPGLNASWWEWPWHPGYGPTSTAPWAREGMQDWLARVPRKKLVMGLPAYGNDYGPAPGSTGRQIYAPKPPVPDGGGYEKFWLPYEQVHVYRYVNDKGEPRVFFASDSDSTRAHLQTIAELGLRGLSFWHYDAVPPDTWELLRSSVNRD